MRPRAEEPPDLVWEVDGIALPDAVAWYEGRRPVRLTMGVALFGLLLAFAASGEPEILGGVVLLTAVIGATTLPALSPPRRGLKIRELDLQVGGRSVPAADLLRCGIRSVINGPSVLVIETTSGTWVIESPRSVEELAWLSRAIHDVRRRWSGETVRVPSAMTRLMGRAAERQPGHE
ncbi:MAG: hypothetical protein AAF211_12980 [Myxococcota bacterium]